MINTICVFCASSSRVDPVYMNAAAELADICADHGIHALYGGGAVGLMGAFANRMIERKAKITGIIPDFMKEREWAHSDVTEMIVVEDMRERKKRLVENVDAVVALPGGIGTLEELLEISTLKQLGRFDKPIFLVNTRNFYRTLLAFMDELIEQQFMHRHNRGLWEVIDTPGQMLTTTQNHIPWNANKINKGAM